MSGFGLTTVTTYPQWNLTVCGPQWGPVHRFISRLLTLGQASSQPCPLPCACQWCLPSMAGLTMDAVNRWVALLLPIASCTGTLCHLPLSCPYSCTPADIMGKAELWSTAHRLFSVPRLAMALIHKQTKWSPAAPLPEKLPSLGAVMSPPSWISRESQFCSVAKLITWIYRVTKQGYWVLF